MKGLEVVFGVIGGGVSMVMRDIKVISFEVLHEISVWLHLLRCLR